MSHKKRLTYRDFVSYFRDKFSNKERHNFEQEVMTDLFESEALEGMAGLTPDELESDVSELQKAVQQKTRKVLPFWRKTGFRVAASVVILLGLFGIYRLLNHRITRNFKAVEVAESPERAFPVKDSLSTEVNIQENLSEAAPVPKTKKAIKKKPINETPKSAKYEYQEDKTEVDDEVDINIDESLRQEEIISVEINRSKEIKSAAQKKSNTAPQASSRAFLRVEAEEITSLTDKNTISGVVTDQNGKPLPGACVVVEGTSVGAVTGSEGQFQLEGVEKGASILFSYAGYLTEKMDVTPGEELTVNMIDDVTTIDDFIVEGYGGVAKTESIATPLSESSVQIENLPDEKAVVKSEVVNNLISGTVLGMEGNPLPGVSVVVKGTTKGTVTDLEGNFTIDGINETTNLVFNYIGYLAEEMSTEPGEEMAVYLAEDVQSLDEVVVIGYGTQKSFSPFTHMEEHQVESYYEHAKPKIIYMIDYKSWIKKQLDYSKFPALNEKYKVEIEFTVNADSTLSEIVINGSPDSTVTNELEQVFKNDKWIPANRDGIPKASKANMSIRLKL